MKHISELCVCCKTRVYNVVHEETCFWKPWMGVPPELWLTAAWEALIGRRPAALKRGGVSKIQIYIYFFTSYAQNNTHRELGEDERSHSHAHSDDGTEAEEGHEGSITHTGKPARVYANTQSVSAIFFCGIFYFPNMFTVKENMQGAHDTLHISEKYTTS